MAIFNKSDLLCKDYNWSTKYTNDDPRITGKPDSNLLNKSEGYEVLYFINKFAEKHNLGKSECLKAEMKIKNEMPSSIRSQIDTLYWLEINWNK